MPSRIHHGRSGERRSKEQRIEEEIQENEDSNNEYTENNRRGVQITGNLTSGKDAHMRLFVDEGSTKRLVVNENEYDNEEEQEDEGNDDGNMLLSENRKKDQLIATLTKKINDLERTVNKMSNATRTDSCNKTG